MPEKDPILEGGKYMGQCISQVPTDYLDYLLDQPWMAEDLNAAILRHLRTRADWLRQED